LLGRGGCQILTHACVFMRWLQISEDKLGGQGQKNFE